MVVYNARLVSAVDREIEKTGTRSGKGKAKGDEYEKQGISRDGSVCYRVTSRHVRRTSTAHVVRFQ
jgi:hypothetical protein